MPENDVSIIAKIEKVTFIREIRKKEGSFITGKSRDCLLWKPKELHEFLFDPLRKEVEK